MSENTVTIIITTISVLFGAGGWKFYEFLIRTKREKDKEKQSEQTIYRDDLIARVERLEKDKNDRQNYRCSFPNTGWLRFGHDDK